MSVSSGPVRRCAVYTRKSSEEGLEQDFNSLHAQREACESYIRSQGGEGWRLIKTAYDDGGLSGGNMERPALRRLLADIRQKQVDVVVVYKVDRLTRSLMDFAKIVEEFDRHGVSFVAVTQQFNTTNSMGRLTLNVLLSFAQFEREVTAERIRDKIAASKRKGMWMGGNVPLGYDVENRKLVVNQEEAKTVQLIYQRYLDLGCVRLLQQDIDKQRIRSKARVSLERRRSGGQVFSRGALYTLLANPIYIGEVRHKGARYKGQHEAILDSDLWRKVQQQLAAQGIARKGIAGKGSLSPLAGKLFDESGNRLVPSHTIKDGRRYRYYVSQKLTTGLAEDAGSLWRLPAAEIEVAVAAEAAKIFKEPTTQAALLNCVNSSRENSRLVLDALRQKATDLMSDQMRAVTLTEIIDRVQLGAADIKITIRTTSVINGISQGLGAQTIERVVALKFKRRGIESKLILGTQEPIPERNQALIKLVARAHKWWDAIAANRGTSLEQFAERQNLSDRYVSRILQFAFLAPPIVEEIVAGAQPASLTADTISEISTLPIRWTQQDRCA